MNNFLLNVSSEVKQLDSNTISWVMMGIIVGGFILFFVSAIIVEIIRIKRKNK